MDKFKVWLASNFDANKITNLKSRTFYTYLTWSSALIIISLVGSLALYFSLVLSTAGEDGTGRALRRWSRLGMPVAFIQGASCFCGIALFFLTVFTTPTFMADAYWLHSGDIGGWAMVFFSIPALCLSTASAIGMTIYTDWKGNYSGEDKNEAPKETSTGL